MKLTEWKEFVRIWDKELPTLFKDGTFPDIELESYGLAVVAKCEEAHKVEIKSLGNKLWASDAVQEEQRRAIQRHKADIETLTLEKQQKDMCIDDLKRQLKEHETIHKAEVINGYTLSKVITLLEGMKEGEELAVAEKTKDIFFQSCNYRKVVSVLKREG